MIEPKKDVTLKITMDQIFQNMIYYNSLKIELTGSLYKWDQAQLFYFSNHSKGTCFIDIE